MAIDNWNLFQFCAPHKREYLAFALFIFYIAIRQCYLHSVVPIGQLAIEIVHYRSNCRVFDRDGNGFITRDELQTAMEMMQETVTEHQVNEMLQLADLDKDGKINYEGNKM